MPDPQDNPLVRALDLFGEIEATLDHQICPEQVKEGFSAPDGREYTVTLTARDWRRYSEAMHALERAADYFPEPMTEGGE